MTTIEFALKAQFASHSMLLVSARVRIYQSKSCFLLYSLYYAEACNEFAGPPLHHCAGEAKQTVLVAKPDYNKSPSSCGTANRNRTSGLLTRTKVVQKQIIYDALN